MIISTKYRIYEMGVLPVDRSEILKKLIDNTGLSMRAFAEKAGLSNTTLHSMLERGIGNASVDNVIKVCKALGISVDQLEKMASAENVDEYDIKSDDIITRAAHKVGHEGPLTDEEKERVELAIKIALSKNGK